MELDFRHISGWWTLFLSSTARDAYMVKPISLPAFLQTVDRLIGSALPFFATALVRLAGPTMMSMSRARVASTHVRQLRYGLPQC
jgi:hypothetical protein